MINKTYANQKIVKVKKQPCTGKNGQKYAMSDMETLEVAARDLDAGAFKLWVYFSKNQDNYEFALSSKAAEETFGIKIKQYNNAVAQLIEKGYLVNTKGNNFEFREKVIPKGNKELITKEDKNVITKEDKELLPKDIRNNTDNTNNTINNTDCEVCQGQPSLETQEKEGIQEQKKEEGTAANPIIVDKQWLAERYNSLSGPYKNGTYSIGDKFYKMR